MAAKINTAVRFINNNLPAEKVLIDYTTLDFLGLKLDENFETLIRLKLKRVRFTKYDKDTKKKDI